MAGISVLGIGLESLSSDTLDKLKENDVTYKITPLQNKLEDENSKKQTLEDLEKSFKELRTVTSSLSLESLYSNTTADSTNSNIQILSNNNVSAQTFSLTSISSAKNDVYNSNEFNSKEESLNLSGDLSITINDIDYDISISASDTLSDISERINSLGGDFRASALNIGNDKYSLMIQSKNTGESNSLSFSGDTTLLSSLNLQNRQTASNSVFEYNGIEMERDSNKINDLIKGLELFIGADNETATITIKEDKVGLSEKFDNFTELYNGIVNGLDSITNSDDSTELGLFSSDSLLNTLDRELKNMVSSNLLNLGFQFQRDGSLFLDKSIFDNKSLDDIKNIAVEGFTEVDDTLYDNIKNNGTINNYISSIEIKASLITNTLNNTQSIIDKKYEIMTQQFASANLQISKYNSVQTYFDNFFNQDSEG